MQAIRRVFTPTCLFLVLVGPWRCQAEAAETLARSLAELVDRDSGSVEATEATECPGLCLNLMEAGARLDVDLGQDTPCPCDGLAWDRPAPEVLSPVAGPTLEPGALVWPFPSASRRQAYLQVFLF